ncbi:MAG: superoxide dismutase [Alphaproteobacteria bacterium]|nr:superoxide dismutase [Alphaproteobacteria bacterium]
MSFELPKLPYSESALEPYISAETISFHYGKHHATYVTNTNNLIKDTPLASKTLEEIIKTTAQNQSQRGIFNNAAQIWNHTFFWNSMKPKGGGKPSLDLSKKIDQAFGSYDQFCTLFKQAATTQFGSGWAWLVQDGDTLKITQTSNADLPLIHRQKPLLTLDVWEHAYYIDYRNKRPDFIQAFLDHLLNWDFVEENLSKK